MIRSLAFVVVAALVAGLLGAASAPPVPGLHEGLPEGRPDGVPTEVEPTLPWPPASVTATGAQAVDRTHFPRVEPAARPAAAPGVVEDRTHLSTREMPALEVVGSRWYEEERHVPTRLYLERLLAGEAVEGWHWDAGYNVEAAADVFERSIDEPLSFGFEGRMERTNAKTEQGDYVEALLVGPSMRWQASQRTHFEVAPLYGIGAPYPVSEVFVAFAWNF